MKLDVERKIDARVVAAFDDIVPGPDAKTRQEILDGVRALVGAVLAQKIYAALPKEKTGIPEYFLDAELEQMLNDAVDECYDMVSLIAERAEEISARVGLPRMERKPLPEDLRDKLNRLRLPTKTESDAMLKRLTPDQLQMLDHRISDTSAKFRRSQFKLVFGGRRRS